ncbi:MAG: UDP-2,3-diacylglucosamine pyrophosphatase LpxI [Holosporales bacterium]
MFGIIAGQGDLPLEIIDHFIKNKTPFVCAGIENSTNPKILDLENIPFKEIPLGQFGAFIDFFKSHTVKKIVLAGSVKRPNIFSLNLDPLAKNLLKNVGLSILKGDDGLLSAIISIFEQHGFDVVSAKDILSSLTLQPGIWTKCHPTAEDEEDINTGIHILKEISKLDIGQAVIIERGLVLGIEAIEGTKALIERILPLKRTNEFGVLVKMAKINQSFKADLPTIGVETIESVHQSKLKGIAIESHGTQILNREAVIQKSNDYGLFLKVF